MAQHIQPTERLSRNPVPTPSCARDLMVNLTKVASSLPPVFNLSYYKMIAPIISTIFFFFKPSPVSQHLTGIYLLPLTAQHSHGQKTQRNSVTHREASVNANYSCSALQWAALHAFNWQCSYLAPSQCFLFRNNQNTSGVDQAKLPSVVSSTAAINDWVSISNLGWKSLYLELNVELTFCHRTTPDIELEVVGRH